MTDTTTGDPRHGATSGCGAPATGAPVGSREPVGQQRASTLASPSVGGYAPPRHAPDDPSLPRPRHASDGYGIQPQGLAPPTARSGYGLPPDDDPAAPPDLARLLRRHVPTRPSWTCASDGRPWPCAAARVHLRSQYAGDAVGLSMYMSQQLMTAAVDLADGGAPPPDLFHRFVAWT